MLELLLRKVDAGELLQSLYRVALEVLQQGGVLLELLDELVHFFLDVEKPDVSEGGK